MGDVQALSDKEAKEGITEALATAEAKIARLEQWLKNPAFTSWYRKLEKMDARPYPSLYRLFNEHERSVAARLLAIGLPHAYLAYSSSSSIIHGSTFEKTLKIAETILAPAVGSSEADLGLALGSATTWAQWDALGLALLLPVGHGLADSQD